MRARPRNSYLDELTRRARESHVYKKYQLEGLEIAEILNDKAHKSLYIKLAKEGHARELRRLAKDVAERTSVRNKGAYFMTLLAKNKETWRRKTS